MYYILLTVCRLGILRERVTDDETSSAVLVLQQHGPPAHIVYANTILLYTYR